MITQELLEKALEQVERDAQYHRLRNQQHYEYYGLVPGELFIPNYE